MVNLPNEKECCGCEACVTVCPRNAVSMAESYTGFWTSEIDSDKCIHCKACMKVCPVLNTGKTDGNRYEKKGYGGFLLDKEILQTAASGGAAYALYVSAVENGMSVCGVSKVFHEGTFSYRVVENKEDILDLCGSKYVETRKSGIYRQVSELIRLKKVLFIGLPCEVSAMKKYVGPEHGNLYTCDLVCKGPCSHLALNRYIQYLESICQSAVKNIQTRYKKEKRSYIRVEFDNGTVYEEPLHDSLLGYAFWNDGRESCYCCKFKGSHHVSDITLGDFWGIGKTDCHDSGNGNSIMIVNTKKGEALISRIQKDMCLYPIDIDDVIKYNPMYDTSRKRTIVRRRFAQQLKRQGILSAVKQSYSLKNVITDKIVRLWKEKSSK